MIISRIHGGLGNQLFQYAVAKSLSLKFGLPFKLDLSPMHNQSLRNFDLEEFALDLSIASPNDLKRTIPFNNNLIIRINRYLQRIGMNVFNTIYFEKELFKFQDIELNNPSIYLYGYWQSYKYFDDFRSEIFSNLELKEGLDEKNLRVKSAMQETSSISLHIRRGDYVKNLKTLAVHGVLGIEYYHNAINALNDCVESPEYFIFSDDLQWARDHLSRDANFNYIDINAEGKAVHDFELMRHSKHNIIANSTFSWWPAYLNNYANKKVIAPKRWLNQNKVFHDLLPSEWIKI
jgi:hypothetical protein